MKINGGHGPLKSGTTNARLEELGVANYILSTRIRGELGLPFPVMMCLPLTLAAMM